MPNPIGTVIASLLTYEQLRRTPHGNEYLPCDGRQIDHNSELGKILKNSTGRASLPDLRGVFLRGLNDFHLEGVDVVSKDQADPEDKGKRIVGSYQPDIFGSHNHGGGNHHHDIHGETGAAGGHGSFITGDNRSSTQWGGNPGVADSGTIIGNEGGKETRPKNVAVYYYIKIN